MKSAQYEDVIPEVIENAKTEEPKEETKSFDVLNTLKKTIEQLQNVCILLIIDNLVSTLVTASD